MQRHRVRAIPSRISASVGFGFLSSNALAVMICPFWQKPHAGTCSSIQACCNGCSFPSVAIPSSVVTSPLTLDVGVTHDRVATPSMITVHAPHCPRPQPNRGPCRSRSLRRIYSSGVEGSMSTVRVVPLTFRVTLLISLLLKLSDSVNLTGSLYGLDVDLNFDRLPTPTQRDPLYGSDVAVVAA